MIFEILNQIASEGMTTAIMTQAVGLLIALVFGISVHEFGHAAAATWLGDTLPRQQGRVTLQPAAHLDPFGSLMFVLAGFGWGRPVEYNPYALRMNPRHGSAIVAIAGPIMNIVLATLVAIIIRLLPLVLGTSLGAIVYSTGPQAIVFNLLNSVVVYNLVLAFFNLIPIPPLDGFSVLMGVLPAEMADAVRPLQQWGPFLLLAVMMLDRYVDILGGLMSGPIQFFYQLLIRFGS